MYISFEIKGRPMVTSEKEIYKIRAEGLKKISALKRNISDTDFLEFISFIRESAVQYQPSIESVKSKVLEKSKIRKNLIRFFKNESIRTDFSRH